MKKNIGSDVEAKSVIRYKKYPNAPKDMEWDGPAQIRESEVNDLKIMCTWFDADNAEVKSAYKLPHHEAGSYRQVWRGVVAAMGALLGARGGVNIPDSDKRGVYNHLAKHYRDFDEEPPEFKDYTESELKELFTDTGVSEHLDDNIIEEYNAEFTKEHEEQMKKNVGQKLYRNFSAKVKDLGNGIMEAIISSEALDRHGEKLDMKGLNVRNYMKNPIMAPFHNYDKPSVGRTLKLTKTKDGKLIAKFEWAKDQNPEARILHDLYRDKFQFAFSIGFMAEEVDGNVFTKSEMLEFSPVLVPANPEALLYAKKKGIDSHFLVGYNEDNMDLTKILSKSIDELTFKEIKYLREHESELSDEQKETYADLLPQKDNSDNIAKAVAEAMEAKLGDVKEQLEELRGLDKTVIKKITKQYDKKNINTDKGEEASKELKFFHYARGLQTGNFSKYLSVVGKSAMNTTDESVLLPPEEFIAEVERLEEQYGVARQFAQVRRSTSGSGIKYLQGDDDLEIYFTDEAGTKQSTSLSYAQKLLAWRKAAGILPITDELTEDSAVDLWNDATTRFARAFARKEDELVFTQASGASPINPGILVVSGTNEVTMTGDSFEDVTYDDLSKMIWGVPTPSAENGRFFLHRTLLGVIQRIKDNEGRPIWQRSMADGTPATILGRPYTLTEVLPSLSDDAAETKFMVYGDLRYSTLGERTGMNIKIFDSGLVGDPDEETQGNDLNLLTQDMQAMRAVKRLNAICRFPAAFSTLVTAAASS
jgi:HK97 family phage major capsid protein